LPNSDKGLNINVQYRPLVVWKVLILSLFVGELMRFCLTLNIDCHPSFATDNTQQTTNPDDLELNSEEVKRPRSLLFRGNKIMSGKSA